jgi:hypothetical protein
MDPDHDHDHDTTATHSEYHDEITASQQADKVDLGTPHHHSSVDRAAMIADRTASDPEIALLSHLPIPSKIETTKTFGGFLQSRRGGGGGSEGSNVLQTTSGVNNMKTQMDVNDFIRAASIDSILVHVFFRQTNGKLYEIIERGKQRLASEQAKQLQLPEEERQEVTMEMIFEQELAESLVPASLGTNTNNNNNNNKTPVSFSTKIAAAAAILSGGKGN